MGKKQFQQGHTSSLSQYQSSGGLLNTDQNLLKVNFLILKKKRE
jgi:hypothetical protein